MRRLQQIIAVLFVLPIAFMHMPAVSAAVPRDITIRPGAMRHETPAGPRTIVFVELPPGSSHISVVKTAVTGTALVYMKDDGADPDMKAGDGIYSAAVDQPTGTDLSVRFRDKQGISYISNPVHYATPTASTPVGCLFHYRSVRTCTSAVPFARVDFVMLGNTSSCSFSAVTDWGDGTRSEVVTIQGRPTYTQLAMHSHMYKAPGTYTIRLDESLVSGPCWVADTTFTFTVSSPPTTASCSLKLDLDRGRLYMLSMRPSGYLKRLDNAPVNNFAYTETIDPNSTVNTFRDSAGTQWKLLPLRKAVYHQPRAWSYLGSPQYNGGIFKKFVALDNSGGSFEAVLMPDGMTPESPLPPENATLTYSNNWLLYGYGVPTYNFVDESAGSWGHTLYDVLPHLFTPTPGNQDGRYVPAKKWINPKTSDWKTYRQRLELYTAEIKNGFRYDESSGSPVLRKGTTVIALADDIAWLMKEASACVQ